MVHSRRRRSRTRYSLCFVLLVLLAAANGVCGGTTTPPVRHPTTWFHPKESPTTLPDDAVLQEFFSLPHHHHGFHIHGWKWHTMSLIHQARRLSCLAATGRDGDEALRTMAAYTIHFNLRGLHRIENEIFFPTLRQRVVSSSTHLPPLVSAAATTVLNQLDQDRQRVAALGTLLVRSFVPIRRFRHGIVWSWALFFSHTCVVVLISNCGGDFPIYIYI